MSTLCVYHLYTKFEYDFRQIYFCKNAMSYSLLLTIQHTRAVNEKISEYDSVEYGPPLSQDESGGSRPAR